MEPLVIDDFDLGSRSGVVGPGQHRKVPSRPVTKLAKTKSQHFGHQVKRATVLGSRRTDGVILVNLWSCHGSVRLNVFSITVAGGGCVTSLTMAQCDTFRPFTGGPPSEATSRLIGR